jgi:two-component system, OmpR family, response regulator RegX3
VTARVLVVEDEPAIAEAVAYALRGEGHDVETFEDGEQALEAASARTFDLVLLDVTLPGLSGLEVCRRIRQEGAVPILMLTARDGEADRVVGLEAGADDYVTKPFSMNELVARTRAILRRRQLDAQEAHPTRAVGSLSLDLERHEVTIEGGQVRLTHSELKLLAFLARDPGRVFSRREIMQHLWDSSFVGDERAADLHVSNIRRKIERDPESPERLLTVRGAGYKLVPV